jgi:hypothetical protein
MDEPLRYLFDEQVEFCDQNGIPIDGSVFIGETEFLPLEILQGDAEAYRSEFQRWKLEIWYPEMRSRREEMFEIPGNQQRFEDIVRAYERRQLVPLVGSGMSVPTGLPTWANFLRGIREFTHVKETDLEPLLQAAAFEEAADLIASEAPKNLLNERIEHDLRPQNNSIVSGSIRLLPGVFNNVVLTTNLDRLLEQQYSSCGNAFNHVLAGREVAKYRQLKDPRERFLLKLHGDCQTPETRVLLTAEYDSAYGVGSTIREELSLLYRNNQILFIGCSLGPDRTVKLIGDVVSADGNAPRHYAFLPCPDCDNVRIDREHFLTSRGIYAIWYPGDHDAAITALLAGLIERRETEVPQ